VAWAFAQCGQDASVERAWIEQHLDEAKGPYDTALAALAFLSHDAQSKIGLGLLKRLADTAEGDAWSPTEATLVGSRGNAGKVETTALAIQALLLADAHPELTASALSQLTGWRKRGGTFGPTQATLQALRALLAATPAVADTKPVRVRVLAGDDELGRSELPAGRTEPIRIDLGSRDASKLKIQLDEGTRLRGTLSHSTWKPWKENEAPKGRVALKVEYPEGELEVGKRAYSTIEIRNPTDKTARIVTAEISTTRLAPWPVRSSKRAASWKRGVRDEASSRSARTNRAGA